AHRPAAPLPQLWDRARRLPDRHLRAVSRAPRSHLRAGTPAAGPRDHLRPGAFTLALQGMAAGRRQSGMVARHRVHAPSRLYGARLVRVRGTYDDVNRLCAQVADRFGWGIVNVNLRSYYGEGSKTVAYEIAEQLGWRLPTAVVAPMAGGSLLSKLRKGFGEFLEAGLVRGKLPRLYGAQAAGCAPIVRLVERGGDVLEPEVPQTICRSLAGASAADGVFA